MAVPFLLQGFQLIWKPMSLDWNAMFLYMVFLDIEARGGHNIRKIAQTEQTE